MTEAGMIQKAIAAHANWKARLRSAVATGHLDEVPVATVKMDNHCEFGKWLHGPAFSGAEKQTEGFRKALELHARFHREAAKIVELAAAGRKRDAENAMGFEGGYTKASSALTNELVLWRHPLPNLPCRCCQWRMRKREEASLAGK
jgi:hypothetical protein